MNGYYGNRIQFIVYRIIVVRLKFFDICAPLCLTSVRLCGKISFCI